jgi:hypothetical protein
MPARGTAPEAVPGGHHTLERHRAPVQELEQGVEENYLCVVVPGVYASWIIGLPDVAKTNPGADGRDRPAPDSVLRRAATFMLWTWRNI